MPGFDTGSVMYALNVDFTGTSLTSGTPQVTTNGQLLIGSTATPNIKVGTITSPLGTISIGYSSPNITIDTIATGFTWSDISGSFSANVRNGYFITTTANATLPATAAEGDNIKFIVDTTNNLTITANTGQRIRIGTTLSASAGTAVNTQRGDAVSLVFRASGSTWFAESDPVGGWNIT